MTPQEFLALLTPITRHIGNRALDKHLEADLNREFPSDGVVFRGVFEACRQAIAAGWMCNREAGGIKFGRVLKPSVELGGFSVDVVEMRDIKGPYHRHPNGEIDMIMPLTPDAEFDGHAAGWLVYGAGSAHSPTVAGGSALVLYLLPQGAIEFVDPEKQV